MKITSANNRGALIYGRAPMKIIKNLHSDGSETTLSQSSFTKQVLPPNPSRAGIFARRAAQPLKYLLPDGSVWEGDPNSGGGGTGGTVERLAISHAPMTAVPATGVQAWLDANINGRTFNENIQLTFGGSESFEISNVTILGMNSLDITYNGLNAEDVNIHDIRGIVNCNGTATIGNYSVIDISNYTELTTITASNINFMNHELSVLGGQNTLGDVQVIGCDLEVIGTTQSTIQSIVMVGGKLQIQNGAYMSVSGTAEFSQTVVIDDRDGRPLEVFQRIPNTKQATIVFDNQSMEVTGVGTETLIYSSNMRGTREVKVMAHQISGAVGNVQFWLKTMAGQDFADYIPICMASTNVSGDQTMQEGQEIVLRTFGDAVLGVTVWEMPT